MSINPQIAGVIQACKDLGAVDPELFGLSKRQKLQLIENSQLANKVLNHDAGWALPPENTELGHPVAAYLEAQKDRTDEGPQVAALREVAAKRDAAILESLRKETPEERRNLAEAGTCELQDGDIKRRLIVDEDPEKCRVEYPA